MSTFLNYCRYYWRAKGRHGTHSPFAYAFVEEVLRKKNTNKNLPQPTFPYTSKQVELLCNTLQFLSHKNVLIISENRLWQEIASIKSLAKQIVTKLQDGTIFILDDTTVATFSLENLPANSVVLIISPYANPAAVAHCKLMVQSSIITCSIDCYDMFLLTNANDFKDKQHFCLK